MIQEREVLVLLAADTLKLQGVTDLSVCSLDLLLGSILLNTKEQVQGLPACAVEDVCVCMLDMGEVGACGSGWVGGGGGGGGGGVPRFQDVRFMSKL